MNEADDARAAAIKAQAHAWWVRLRSGRASVDDAQAYRRWCAEHPDHAQAAREFTDAWSALSTAAAEVIEEQPAAARSWDGKASPGRTPAFRPGRRAFAGFAVVAGASWLALRPPLGLWPSLGDYVADYAADYRTGTGEQRRLALSDQVVVEMNTQTRLNLVTAQAGSTARHDIDLLAGEAEIVTNVPAADITARSVAPVTSALPVVVAAGRGRVQAKVARFDIRRTDDEVCVTCVSGSVTIEHPQRHLTLLAAQQVIFDNHGVRAVSRVDSAATTAWRQGLLVFRNVPLAQVVDEINRYRPGKLILRNTDLRGSLVQAQVSIAKVDDAVGMLAKLYDMRVTRLPGNIALLS
jgi:transmembrane sensor